MPKVRRSRKPPPEGWELIEPTLEELDQKMREGKINDPLMLYYDDITYIFHKFRDLYSQEFVDTLFLPKKVCITFMYFSKQNF